MFVGISCTDEQPTEPNYGSVFERLQGKWTILEYYNGWGKTETYQPSNKPAFVVHSDTTFSMYGKDSAIISRETFDIIRDESIRGDSVWMMRIPKGVSLPDGGEYWMFEFKDDKLILADEAYDSFTFVYKRIR
ncbi:MAG TPA: hypothetical protein VEC36_09775 [Patescibacteria group bacterium]|nr:hypothetical protein [Patescibacteria group bacterium]